MDGKKINFAIIGCGRIGERHASKIKNCERAKLVAVCDAKEELAKNLSDEYKVPYYTNYKELLKNKYIDVVNICTPSGFHAKMSLEALKKKKNVLCEKPMTLCLSDADKIVETEKKNGKKFFLVKQNRYNPPIMALKDAVYNEKLGRIAFVNCNVLWNRHRQYYEEAGWRGTMKHDGGTLMTQCSHFLDLMVWIGGPVKKVTAKMDNLCHDYIETEDTGIITLVFENGCIGSLQYTTCVYNHNLEGTMMIIGSKGSVKIGGQYLNTIELWDVENETKPKLEQGNPPNDYGTYKGSMSNHDKVIQNVVEVLLDNKKIATNSIQGRESIEVMQAAYLSAIKNKPVGLPLKGKDYKFKISEQKPFTGKKKSV